MGTVYLARRADDAFERGRPSRRSAAAWTPRRVIGRFRHERQILATLEHPNIARLLDGGTTRTACRTS